MEGTVETLDKAALLRLARLNAGSVLAQLKKRKKAAPAHRRAEFPQAAHSPPRPWPSERPCESGSL